MPPANPRQVVEEALSWVLTPFDHHGREKGVRVDCAGVVVKTAEALDLPGWQTAAAELDYSRQPDGRRLRALCTSLLLPVAKSLIEPGCVALMRWRQDPQHLGIVGYPGDGYALTLIHAYEAAGRCIHHGIDGAWDKRIVGAFRYPGVAYERGI